MFGTVTNLGISLIRIGVGTVFDSPDVVALVSATSCTKRGKFGGAWHALQEIVRPVMVTQPANGFRLTLHIFVDDARSTIHYH